MKLYLPEICIIQSRKFDGQIHKHWKAKFIKQEDSLIMFVGIFDFDIEHEHLGFIRRGTISHEFFWTDRFYNIFRFHEPNGNFRNYYCNLSLPAVFQSGTLDFVDLDIDILVNKNYELKILDLDEFEINFHKYSYPDEIRTCMKKNIEEITNIVTTRQFPFDFHELGH